MALPESTYGRPPSPEVAEVRSTPNKYILPIRDFLFFCVVCVVRRLFPEGGHGLGRCRGLVLWSPERLLLRPGFPHVLQPRHPQQEPGIFFLYFFLVFFFVFLRETGGAARGAYCVFLSLREQFWSSLTQPKL